MSTEAFVFCLVFLSYFLVFFNGNDVETKTRVIIGALAAPMVILFLVGDLVKSGRIKWLVLGLSIFLFVIVPTGRAMYLRQVTGGYSYVHDNPLQIEEAASFLSRGINPYGQDYSKTTMGKWRYLPWVYDFSLTMPPAGFFRNPALTHVVSLPLGFILPLPFQILFTRMFGFFDVRIIYLLAYIVFLWFSYKLIPKDYAMAGLIALAFNPISTPYLLGGRNDILTLALIAAGIYYGSQKKPVYAGLLLGCAVATKQSAWIFMPLYAYYLWLTVSGRRKLSYLARVFVPSALVAMVCILPFFLWNTKAFMDDTVGYVSGTLVTSYPIRGFGLSMLLVALGRIPNVLGSYPAGVFQGVAFSIGAIGSFFAMRRESSLQILLVCYGICLLSVLYPGRFFVDNYLGFVLQVFILAYFTQPTYNRAS